MIPIVVLQGYGPHERRIRETYEMNVVDGQERFTVSGVPRPMSGLAKHDPLAAKHRNLDHLVEACRTSLVPQDTQTSLLVVRDSAVPMLSSTELHKRITLLLNSPDVHRVDMFYLCHWEDECQKYTNYPLPGVSKGEGWAKYTMAPHGNQAWLITPWGLQKILGLQSLRQKCGDVRTGYIPALVDTPKEQAGIEWVRIGEVDPEVRGMDTYGAHSGKFEGKGTTDATLHYYISHGELRAVATTENWFEFDLNLSQKNSHYRRCNRCLSVPDISARRENNLIASLLWLVLFILLLVFLGIALVQMRS